MKYLKRWGPFVTLALGMCVPGYILVMMARDKMPVTPFTAKLLGVWMVGLVLYALVVGYGEEKGRDKSYKQLLAELAYGSLPAHLRAREVYKKHNTN